MLTRIRVSPARADFGISMLEFREFFTRVAEITCSPASVKSESWLKSIQTLQVSALTVFVL
jgi:hypothetical protein